MARGRMIDNCISISEKINDLSLKEAFIYTWIIPHLDDWGRISGSLRTLKALVFPMKDEIKTSDIESALIKFKQIGLFLWESVNGDKVLQQPFEEFNSHQHISENKRTKSKYPDIFSTSPESPRKSGESPESPNQFNLIKENLREDIKDIAIDVSDETSTAVLETDDFIPKGFLSEEPLNEDTPPKKKSESKISFDREERKFIGITEKDIDLWMAAYPAVDLNIETSKAIAWIFSAGSKGYKSNWRKFLTGWYSRCQDRGGSNVSSRQ